MDTPESRQIKGKSWSLLSKSYLKDAIKKAKLTIKTHKILNKEKFGRTQEIFADD